MITGWFTRSACHTIRGADSLVSPIGTDDGSTVSRAAAARRRLGSVDDTGTTPPRGITPDDDTSPQPALTAEALAAAAAAGPAAPGEHDPDTTAPQPVLTPAVMAALGVPTPDDAATAGSPGGVTGRVVTVGPEHAHLGARPAWHVVAAVVTAALLVLGVVGTWVANRGTATAEAAGPVGSTQSPGGTASAPVVGGVTPVATRAAMLPASSPTLVLGDSLGLDVYPWLADLLPDRYVSYEAEVGRSTAHTLTALEAMPSVPSTVIVSSGTNDQYASDVGAEATAILDRLGTQRCVVWVDVVRPDRVGDPQADINAALDRAVAGRPNVTVLRWSQMVAANPGWMTRDGIHPDGDGAQARAQAFADAAKACSPFDPSAPPARRQVLPQSVFVGPISGGGSTGTSTSGSTGSGSTASRQPTPSPTRAGSPSSTSSGSPTPSRSPTRTPTPTTSSPSPETSPPSKSPSPSTTPTPSVTSTA